MVAGDYVTVCSFNERGVVVAVEFNILPEPIYTIQLDHGGICCTRRENLRWEGYRPVPRKDDSIARANARVVDPYIFMD